MGMVNIRTNFTSRGFLGLCPYTGRLDPRIIGIINLENNFITKLEIVSALNSFNLALAWLQYSETISYQKYNPKVYLGAVQSVARSWNNDDNSGHRDLSKKWQLLYYDD